MLGFVFLGVKTVLMIRISINLFVIVKGKNMTNYCAKCGKELMDEAVICPNCGCEQRPSHANNEDSVV